MTLLDQVCMDACRAGHVTVSKQVLREMLEEAKKKDLDSPGHHVMLLMMQIADQQKEIDLLRMQVANLAQGE